MASKAALEDVWTHRTPTAVWIGPLGQHSEAGGLMPTSTSARRWLHVLQVLARHEFRSRYRAQALGIWWSLIQPLVSMVVLSIIFGGLFRSETKNFPVFVLVGVLVWKWLTSTLTSATQSFVSNAGLIKHTVLPRELLPISVVVSATVTFAMESSLILVFIPVYPDAFRISSSLLYIPIFLLFGMALITGLSLVVSVLNVVFRDLAYLVSTALLLFYWLTPVMYPLDIVAEPYRTVLRCNPIGSILTVIRDAAMNGRAPSTFDWIASSVPAVVALVVGWFAFKRLERIVLDYV